MFQLRMRLLSGLLALNVGGGRWTAASYRLGPLSHNALEG